MTFNLNAITFLIQNFDSVLLVVAFIFSIIATYKHKSLEGIKQMLFAVVTAAEEKYGPGMGLLKKGEVAAYVWEHIPSPVQIFVTQKNVEDLIDRAVEEAKGKWAQSASLTEYISHHNEPETDPLNTPIPPIQENPSQG